MAVKQIRVDDIDGTEDEGVESVEFVFKGKLYEVDLSPENRETMDSFLETYAKAGRRVQGLDSTHKVEDFALQSQSRGGKQWPKYDANSVRQWATENDFDVNPTGRIKNAVLEAYFEANPA